MGFRDRRAEGAEGLADHLPRLFLRITQRRSTEFTCTSDLGPHELGTARLPADIVHSSRDAGLICVGAPQNALVVNRTETWGFYRIKSATAFPVFRFFASQPES
jgi:hypothetical protein